MNNCECTVCNCKKFDAEREYHSAIKNITSFGDQISNLISENERLKDENEKLRAEMQGLNTWDEFGIMADGVEHYTETVKKLPNAKSKLEWILASTLKDELYGGKRILGIEVHPEILKDVLNEIKILYSTIAASEKWHAAMVEWGNSDGLSYDVFEAWDKYQKTVVMPHETGSNSDKECPNWYDGCHCLEVFND